MPTLVEVFPKCEFCDEKARRWRLPMTPPYGFDEEGKSRTDDEFAGLLVSLLETGQPLPEGTYGTCPEHLDYVWEDGKPALTLWGRDKLARAEKARARGRVAKDARVHAIQEMGGCCQVCGKGGEESYLRIVPPNRLRAELGLTSPHKWFNALLASPDLRKKCQLLCLDCQNTTQVNPLNLKAEAVAAYGGSCPLCGETDPGALWIVPKPDTPALATSGGRKLSSRDKVVRLAQLGFPSGWSVRCPEHAYAK